jgi:hypothetical protein
MTAPGVRLDVVARQRAEVLLAALDAGHSGGSHGARRS